jgi:hypothetical protein
LSGGCILLNISVCTTAFAGRRPPGRVTGGGSKGTTSKIRGTLAIGARRMK